MLRVLYFCSATVLALVLAGCGHERGAPPAPPPPTVSVAQPILYPVQRYHEYNGNLEAVERVQITARVKGFLKEILFTEGAEVNEGDLLFRIDPREYQAGVKVAEADLRKAITEMNRTRLEAERGRQLRGTSAISAEEQAQRVAAFESAEAVVAQSQAALEARQLEFSFTEIYSPIAGQISRTLITRGNLVGQTGDTLLTSVVSMDPLFVYFDAPERDLVENLRTLREGGGADVLSQTLRVEIGVTTEDGYPHVGRIDFRENRVDSGTGTVRIRGRIPNPRVAPGNARLLYPGLYARVRVPIGAPLELPAIPEDALMTGQEGRFVYVLDEKNVVQKRSVTVGPHVYKETSQAVAARAGWTRTPEKPEGEADPVTSVVAIEKGLEATDRIIINGLTRARPGSPVAPQAWVVKPPANNPNGR